MKTIRLLGLTVGLAFAGSAFAGDIYLTPADCDDLGGSVVCWTSDQNNAEDAAMLAGLTGYSAADLMLLYKGDQDGSPDSGSYAGAYDTTFSNPSDDPEDAHIEWLDGAFIDCGDGCLVVVKDGNASPNIFIFEVTAAMWNGEGDIYFTGFFPACSNDTRNETCWEGAISHVSIWGGSSTTVPEPGTLALLGIGLFGMGAIGRRRRS